MLFKTMKPGDPVIYQATKRSPHPGPRAQQIHPTPRGDDYCYNVSKFWVVAEVRDDGTLLLRTRRGKEHVVEADDPNLRRARLWERLIYRSRFPHLTEESVAAAH